MNELLFLRTLFAFRRPPFSINVELRYRKQTEMTMRLCYENNKKKRKKERKKVRRQSPPVTGSRMVAQMCFVRHFVFFAMPQRCLVCGFIYFSLLFLSFPFLGGLFLVRLNQCDNLDDQVGKGRASRRKC